MYLQETLPVDEAGASFGCREKPEEQLGAVAQLARRLENVRLPQILETKDCFRVARQFLHSIVRNLDAEISRGHILDLMRLVKDHGGVLGQQTGEIHLLQGQ